MKFKNKTVVITGSSQGIGKEIAKQFLTADANVVINGRDAEKLDSVLSEFSQLGFEKIIAVVADISKQDRCDFLVKEAIHRFGSVDILINNAATSFYESSENLSSMEWNEVLNLNLSGSFYCSQIATREYMKENGGQIIMMSSILGQLGLAKRAAYCSTKHALIGLTKALAVEWAKYKIQVNSICPSYVLTEMEIKDSESGEWGYTSADIIRRTPLGRYADPIEVAKLCLWLCSDENSFMTGASINIDGGWAAYGGW